MPAVWAAEVSQWKVKLNSMVNTAVRAPARRTVQPYQEEWWAVGGEGRWPVRVNQGINREGSQVSHYRSEREAARVKPVFMR